MRYKKKEFCKRGHPLTDENLFYNDKYGISRQCRICKNERSKKWLRVYRAKLKLGKIR